MDSHPLCRHLSRAGFTLVELLVVIAIVALLVSLLLPAIGAARETARITHCRNNLKQLGLGANLFHDAHDKYPTHPKIRVRNAVENSSWITQLFPFIEEQALHDLLENARESRSRVKLAQVASTPIPLLYCPTRREAAAYPRTRRTASRARAKTDYAMCGGGGDERSEGQIAVRKHGIWHRMGKEMTREKVVDGTAKTYLIGEKSVAPQDYLTGRGHGDSGTIVGCERGECVRYAFKVPGPDRPSGCFACHDFGSAHRTLWNMVYCDGSVRGLSYGMDYAVHTAMSSPAGQEKNHSLAD